MLSGFWRRVKTQGLPAGKDPLAKDDKAMVSYRSSRQSDKLLRFAPLVRMEVFFGMIPIFSIWDMILPQEHKRLTNGFSH